MNASDLEKERCDLKTTQLIFNSFEKAFLFNFISFKNYSVNIQHPLKQLHFFFH